VAWRRVADPLVTDFERREIRNHIKESDEALRYYLGRCQNGSNARLAPWKMSVTALQRLNSDCFLPRSLRIAILVEIGNAVRNKRPTSSDDFNKALTF